MVSVAQFLRRAVDAHQQAMAYAQDAEAQLRALESDGAAAVQADLEQRRWAAKLHELAQSGLRGWLGAPLDAAVLEFALGRDAVPDRPMCLRIGDASLVQDCTFWAVTPFVGAGHLAIDRDAREPSVAAWLRGILLRTLGALPDGMLRVLPVDGATLGSVFAPFRPLMDAEAWAVPATDLAGLRTVLDEAEKQINQVQAGELNNPPVLLVAVAAAPAGTGRAEWARLAAIAHAGPAGRVHLLLAGWPPPVMHGEPPPKLENTTQLTDLGEGWFRMSEPPGPYRVSVDGSGLPAPRRLDIGAAADIITAVCRQSAATATVARRTDFASLMPEQIWRESSAHGLRAVVGRDGREPFLLSLDDATPHTLLGGRSGAGKTNVLLVLLYVLASRYSPAELGMYLLDSRLSRSMRLRGPMHAGPDGFPRWWVELAEQA